MVPTIIKDSKNLVISTGNVINNEFGRKSNEELFEGLKVAITGSQGKLLTGELQRFNQTSDNKFSENTRNEISIAAKIFLNKNSSAYIRNAMDAVLRILDVTHIDNVVLAYHPKADNNKTSLGTKLYESDGNSLLNWNERNGEQGSSELKILYKELEHYASEKKIVQLGIADVDAKTLAQLNNSAKISPTIVQINLASCCFVPAELQEYCNKYDIQLLTHADSEILLSDEDFGNLIPSYTVNWILRYQVHLRCRGVLTAKGYIIGATKQASSGVV